MFGYTFFVLLCFCIFVPLFIHYDNYHIRGMTIASHFIRSANLIIYQKICYVIIYIYCTNPSNEQIFSSLCFSEHYGSYDMMGPYVAFLCDTNGLSCSILSIELYVSCFGWLFYHLTMIIDFYVLITEQITDAVAVAYILNATLIVPMLDQQSYWKDARFVLSCLCISS